MILGYDLIQQLYPDFPPDALRNAATLLELAFAEDMGTPMPGFAIDTDAADTFGIALAMERDVAMRRPGDMTGDATIPANARGSARFVARAPGTLAGLPVLHMALFRFGVASTFETSLKDGDLMDRGATIGTVYGPVRALLAMERTALNFLQRLSGVATMTARFVKAVEGTKAVILDTRKTTPGWRALEKYAVRCGGGVNHRIGLHDAVLIKDNHLAFLADGGDPIGRAVAAGRAFATKHRASFVEVEVDVLDQLDRALACGPDIVLLDNFAPADLAEAVRRRNESAPSILLEASGGVNLDTVRAIAASGVDRISVGALTHSAPATDIALDHDAGGPT
jgi:nicotinate-nucleotide pyrophosphorylase (carboxylating)